MKRWWLLAFALVQTFAMAQTVSFTANLSSYTGTPARAYLVVTLRVPSGCVPASATAVPVGPQRFTPAASSGAIATTLVPNTAITCGGIGDKTDYLLEVYQQAANSGERDKKLYAAEYKVGPGDFDLATAVPVTPVSSNPLYDYAIRNGDNAFTGVQDFSGARLAGVPLVPAFLVENPDTSLDGVLSAYIAHPITLTRVRCPLIGSGAFTIQLEIRTDPDVEGTAMLTDPLVCDGTSMPRPSTTSFAQATIPAGSYVTLRTLNSTGTPVWLRVYLEY